MGWGEHGVTRMGLTLSTSDGCENKQETDQLLSRDWGKERRFYNLDKYH